MENNFLSKPLAACHNAESNLVMNFTVNIAIVNYIDQFNLRETLPFLILSSKTTFEHTLPIFLNDVRFDTKLLSAPQTLKDYILQYNQKKEIFDLQERHDTMNIRIP